MGDGAIRLIYKANEVIFNPIIALLFAVALVVFLWGLVQFLASDMTDDNREKGKQKIIWGVVGLFIMLSVYGIINLILNTFGISPPDIINV